MKVHHNTTKRALKAGIALAIEGDMIVASKGDRELSRHEDAKIALDEALRELNGGALPKRDRKPSKARARKEDDFEADDADADADIDEEDGEKETKSIVKPKYRKIYRPHRDTCGDSLTDRIRREFQVEGEDGETEYDWARFTRFAKANNCWVASYASLNKGMRRMNVGNRLRKLIEDGVKIDWDVA